MELINLYNEYKAISEELLPWLEACLKEEALELDKHVCDKLEGVKAQLEALLEQAEDLKEVNQEEDVRDLRYLLTDALFLIIDLNQMAQHQDVGRFKMRAINYISKRRRAEVFE